MCVNSVADLETIKKINFFTVFENDEMEVAGIEPAAFRLQSERATTAPYPLESYI